MLSQSSLSSAVKSTDGVLWEGGERKEAEKPKSALVEAERSEVGKVKLAIYLDYIRAVGVGLFALYVLLTVASSGLQVGSNLWLSSWSESSASSEGNAKVGFRLGVYAALGLGRGLAVLVSAGLVSLGFFWASEKLHLGLLANLLRSPMSFFDTTPSGRIINRCGKDVDIIDNQLPMSVRSWVTCVLNVLATLAVIISATPWFTVVIVPLGVLYFFVLRFFISTARQLKRLESVSVSPVYSHFQETIQGSAVIRAFGVQDRFAQDIRRLLNQNLICQYPSIVSNRWLGVRLEFTGNLIVFFAALFAVLSDSITAGVVGLSVSYALQVTQTLNWAVRQTSELETSIVAVERVQEYARTPNEAAWESRPGQAPPKEWPEKGEVVFRDYATRYRQGLDLVVKGINVHIRPGEKVGIVGRTGAGKSSLTLALFRLIEPAAGAVVIDGRDIASVGLHDLRSKISIIPQDPVLFSGTLRSNLDPRAVAGDAALWGVLEEAGLKELGAASPLGLGAPVAEGGENLSVGQRQLVCLARALLRRTKVLVLDEATAAVDLDTDALIQATIRQKFPDSTLITIAHRLNTILDYDRILVMDEGKVVEEGPPGTLLEDHSTIFHSMAAKAGIVEAQAP